MTEIARGLPGSAYTDPAVLAAERSAILDNAWACLCREDEVANPGDWLATEIFDEPVVVVRDRAGVLRVLSNVCRHRGMLIAEGGSSDRGPLRRLSCPYHAWSWQLDGAFHGAPRMGERHAGHACDLPSYPHMVRAGFVFASRDPAAEESDLAALWAAIGDYAPETFRSIGVFAERWPCNWKLLVENFMDAYHLSVVHPQTLRPQTPSHLSRKGPAGETFSSYIAAYAPDAPLRPRAAPGLSDERRHQSHLFCVYPGLIASVSADTLAFYSLRPDGPEAVQVRWGLACIEPDLPAAEARSRIDKWTAINAEDHAILARLQIGQGAAAFSPGPLASDDQEGVIADFHRWWRRRLNRG